MFNRILGLMLSLLINIRPFSWKNAGFHWTFIIWPSYVCTQISVHVTYVPPPPPPPKKKCSSCQKIIIDCLFEATFGQSYLSLKCSKRLYCIGGYCTLELKIIWHSWKLPFTVELPNFFCRLISVETFAIGISLGKFMILDQNSCKKYYLFVNPLWQKTV